MAAYPLVKHTKGAGMKRCSKCQKIKPLADFYLIRRGEPETQPLCKPCDNERTRQDYQSNIEARREKRREWQELNADKQRKYSRDYYRKNPEMKMKTNRKYDLKYKDYAIPVLERFLTENKSHPLNNKEWRDKTGATLRRYINEIGLSVNIPDGRKRAWN